MKRAITSFVMILAALGLSCSFGLGQTASSPPDKVEEDWQVVIASPSPDEAGPQIRRFAVSSLVFGFRSAWRFAVSFAVSSLVFGFRSAGNGAVALRGVLQPIMPLDLPVKVRPWELTVYPRSHIRR